METKNEAGLKVGDILASSWGYSMTIASFYIVTKVTKCFATVEEIGNVCESTGYQQGWAYPNSTSRPRNPDLHPPLRRKVLTYGSRPFVAINSFENAYLYDGKPTYYDHND